MNKLHHVKGSKRDALLSYPMYRKRHGKEVQYRGYLYDYQKWSFLGKKVALLEGDMFIVQWLLSSSKPNG